MKFAISEKAKRFMCVMLVAGSLFLSQIACDDELDSTRKAVGNAGCADTAARDACGGDTNCRIAACQN